jgi:transcriptional antiterminator RfaH
MKRWYVIHTLPKGEEKALQHLQQQGYEAFLPRFHKTRRHARKMEVVIAPLFPRYMFVRFDAENEPWLAINSTRGVAYLVRQKGCPMPVPMGVIEELMHRADVKEVVPLSSLELFEAGATLEILEGAFAGHTGTFEKMSDSERVQLLLNVLGREVKIAVSLHSVMAVA